MGKLNFELLSKGSTDIVIYLYVTLNLFILTNNALRCNTVFYNNLLSNIISLIIIYTIIYIINRFKIPNNIIFDTEYPLSLYNGDTEKELQVTHDEYIIVLPILLIIVTNIMNLLNKNCNNTGIIIYELCAILFIIHSAHKFKDKKI